MGVGDHTKPHRGRTDDWLTPPDILAALGPFDLDPCCPSEMPWRTADRMLTELEDGLSAEWSGRVWLNPPYGPRTSWWLKRLAHHGNGVALVFARTETAMFHRWVWPVAHGLLFLAGRLHFHRLDGSRADGNAGGPSVLVAYGVENAAALSAANLRGDIRGAFVPFRRAA